ncbi:hypothetical protein [Nocardia nova]|uniref:hypothetical protein n=1 Tax=Nocardia nova TaxID=37330 RepID=UPI0015E401E1|nr:hypothetical protein [Nocardia nova]
MAVHPPLTSLIGRAVDKAVTAAPAGPEASAADPVPCMQADPFHPGTSAGR